MLNDEIEKKSIKEKKKLKSTHANMLNLWPGSCDHDNFIKS
jgi:hypothetical protein